MTLDEARQSIGAMVRVRCSAGSHANGRGPGRVPGKITGVTRKAVLVHFLVGPRRTEPIDPRDVDLWKSHSEVPHAAR